MNEKLHKRGVRNSFMSWQSNNLWIFHFWQNRGQRFISKMACSFGIYMKWSSDIDQ